MNISKAIFHTLAIASILGLATTASASTSKTQAVRGVSVAPSGQVDLSGRYTPGHVGERLLGSSSTASFFYSKGVKNFERGNLDKAEQAFKAVLRAKGSKRMDALTLRYLIHINQQQDDKFASNGYKQAYLKLAEN